MEGFCFQHHPTPVPALYFTEGSAVQDLDKYFRNNTICEQIRLPPSPSAFGVHAKEGQVNGRAGAAKSGAGAHADLSAG